MAFEQRLFTVLILPFSVLQKLEMVQSSTVYNQRRSKGARGRPSHFHFILNFLFTVAPNDEKVDVREMLKSAIKSIHWKAALN